MILRKSMRAAVQGTAMVVIFMSAHGVAVAQDNVPDRDGEFLGTIDLGESTRAVQTGTAVPLTVVNQEEIDDRQANTIAELVDSVPGVTLINGSTPSGSGINIRGFGANGTYGTDQKVAVQVDGASVGSEELYRIGTQLYTDPSLYKSVDVIRGTVGSFEYGSGIVGGIVRLQTRDASDLTGGEPGVAFSQTLGGGTNREAFNSSSTLAWMPSENVEFLANYSWREQGTQRDGDGNSIENSAFGLPSFLMKGLFHLGSDGEHSIRANFSQTKASDRDVPYDTFGTTSGAFGNVDRDTLSQVAILGYNFNPLDNDAVDVDLQFSYANQKIDQQYVEGSGGPPGGYSVVNADQRYETRKLTLKNTAFFDSGPISHNLRIGAEYIQKDRLDAASAPGGRDKRIAFFLVDEMEMARGLTLSPAVRYESSTIDGVLDDASVVNYKNNAIMGGVSMRYELPFGLAAFGSIAYTESLPILDDLENAINMQMAEKATTFELGASYDKSGLFGEGDRLAFKLNYYDTGLKDVTSYFGVSQVDLDGFEIEASYATAGGFYLDFNANIVSGQETGTGGAISDWRNLAPDSYQISVGKRFDRWLNVRWESTITSDTDEDGTVTEGFDSHNLRVIVTPTKGLLKNTAIRLSVENLTDNLYTPLRSTRPAPGRNLKISVTQKF